MTLKISKEVRIFIFSVVGACVLAISITVAVMLTRNTGTKASEPTSVNLARSLPALDLSDFQIPQSYTEAWKLQWHASRDRQERWTWEEVQRYWHDPRKSALSSITQENDKKVSELFKGVR